MREGSVCCATTTRFRKRQLLARDLLGQDFWASIGKSGKLVTVSIAYCWRGRRRLKLFSFDFISRGGEVLEALVGMDQKIRVGALSLKRIKFFLQGINLIAVLVSPWLFAQSSASVVDAPGQPITLFHGGTVLMLDAAFNEAEALAIKGDKILAVGDRADLDALAGPDAQRVDISGLTIVPGFIDPHAHPIVGVATSVFEDVGITRFVAVEDALRAMSLLAENERDWHLYIGLDLATQSFSEPSLTIKHLDAISRVEPVVVWHAGGHRMTVNSVMLARLNIGATTVDPPDSEYGRFDDGSPDGNIAGLTAVTQALNQIEPFQLFDRYAGSVNLAREWVRHGVTTVGLASVATPKDWQMVERLGHSIEFPLRTRSYLLWQSLDDFEKADIGPGRGDSKARIVGWKAVADGSNQAFTGLQRDRYAGRDTHGLVYMDQEALYQAVVNGSGRGGQLAIHGNGDAGIDNIIEAVKRARAVGAQVSRPRIEHCSMVQDDQLIKLKANGISCSFLIAHVRYWGRAFIETVFGPEKAKKLDRAGSFERANIPFSLHSDYPVSTLTPLQMMQVAVDRKLHGSSGEILAPAEAASVEAALKAITAVPAWQTMSDHEIGSLEPGKLADFVLLESDPRKVPRDEIGQIKVLGTWIGGSRVH